MTGKRTPPAYDPLTSPLVAGLLFGGVFLVVFLWHCALALLSGKPLSAFRDPELLRVLWMMLAFSLASGLGVAGLRRLFARSRMRRRNLGAGLVVAACYAASCALFFGGDLPPGEEAGLALFVFAGVAWAVTSALNELLG